MDLLKQTADSVIRLQGNDWEWILVDDGSDQLTKDFCIQLASDNSRIKFLQRKGEKKGAPVCRNIGWKSASFDLILFLDSDDLIGENAIQFRLKSINQRAENDFWIFPTAIFYQYPHDYLFLVNSKDERDDLDRFCFGENIWQTLGVIWKKDFLEKLHGFNEDLPSFQDWDLSFRSLLEANNYHYDSDSKPSAFYRQTMGESISNNRYNERNAIANSKMIADAFESMNSVGKVTEVRRVSLLNFYISRLKYWTFVETSLSRRKMILEGIGRARKIGLITDAKEENFIQTYLLLYVSKWNAIFKSRRKNSEERLKKDPNYQKLIVREPYAKVPYTLD